MKVWIIFFALHSLFLFSDENVERSSCNGNFVDYCKYDDSKYFIGFCSNDQGREVGKTFYKSGVTFKGSYYNDIDSVGTYTWTNGDSFKGELGVINAGYAIEDAIAEEELFAIGQYVEGTVTSRGFFILNSSGRFELIGFGTDFDTNPESEFNYRAGEFKNKELISHSLITYGNFEFWTDFSKPIETRLLYVVNGEEKNVYKFQNNETVKIRSFNEVDEVSKQEIEKKIEFNKKTLDKNFELLDNRLDQIDKFFAGEETKQSKSIKPLSSDLVRSIQELLTILGYEVGEVDGILGPLTRAGIKAYEKVTKLPMVGNPTESILISLQESVRLKNNELAIGKELPKELPVVSSGTGFYINQDHLVTNYHVVQKCNYLSIQNEGLLTIETQDQINDIAILKSSEISEHSLSLFENPQLGQSIFTGGYPYNDVLDNFNFTTGNVSGLRGTRSNISQFQFTAPVQPGSSGGPILSEKGGVVGVTVSGLGASFAEARNTLPQNIAFGIKVGVVKDILNEEGIKFSQGQEFWFTASQEKIAQLAKDASVVVQCHSSI